jgi:ribosomal protein L40E
MAEKELGYVKLVWTCPNCNTKNPGPEKTCSSCRYPQPDDVAFEQATQEELITDETQLAQAKKGPDIHCRYCGARNLADAATCTQCGANLAEGAKRASGQVLGAHRDKPTEKIACRSCGEPNDPDASKCVKCGASLAEPKKPVAKPTSTQPGGFTLLGLPVVAVVAIALLCVGCLVFAFLFMGTSDTAAQVNAVSWTRTIIIEEQGPVTRTEEDWEDEIPADAEVGVCTDKVRRTTDTKPSGANFNEVCGTPYTKDQGSGFGKVVQDCEYEVLEPWCEYEVTVLDWKEVDQETLTGEDANPKWPNLRPKSNQRERREAAYEIVFKAESNTYTYTTDDEQLFARCEIGSRWTLKVNSFGSVTAIESAQ